MPVLTASDSWIIPEWSAPTNVRALTTTRIGGCSEKPYDGLNLAAHVGDSPESMDANRSWLQEKVGLPESPRWLSQVHGTKIISADDWVPSVEADGCYSFRANQVCAVLTADCLPVFLSDRDGEKVAVVHAGWRGLAAGILPQAVEKIAPGNPDRFIAWLGPAISAQAFVVGDEVRAAFMRNSADSIHAFSPAPDGAWNADLYMLARQQLSSCGVSEVFGGQFCTYGDSQRYYSFRRDGETGRMASLIWIDQDSTR